MHDLKFNNVGLYIQMYERKRSKENVRIVRRRRSVVAAYPSLEEGLTTVTLLHADFAIGSDLQDSVNTIKTKGEYSENDSRQHFSKKSLVIFIPDLPSELAGENYQKGRKPLLRSQDLSNQLFKVDNDKQKISAASIIKKNSTNSTSLGYKWELAAHNRRPKNRSERMMHMRQQQAMERRESAHERRVKEIVEHVSVHYQSCIYLSYEAHRIKTGGVVMDDFRKLAEDVEKQKYQGLKAKALKCGKPIPDPAQFVWHTPNKVIINVVKDSINDGVL